MKISTQPYKGARDFYPTQKREQQWLFETWKRVVESFGYEAYDAPILEPTDLYLMKGSQEIIKEQTYTFTDRGDRSVTIRTEMTPSVSRMIAGQRQELAYPVRWYSIPNLWRYERMQKGRLREFWQLNVDMFGIESLVAELEMIQIVDALFQAFKARRNTYEIRVNSRRFVDEILTKQLALTESKAQAVIRLTDKKSKMSLDDFTTELESIVSRKDTAQKLLTILSIQTLDDVPGEIQNLTGYKELKELTNRAKACGITNCIFDITLMRGFDYYTDIVFEAFDTGDQNTRAMLGGGRYDGLVGQFGVEPVPTIGFAVGDVVFMDYLKTYDLVATLVTPIELTLLPTDVSVDYQVNSLAERFRQEGLKVSVDYTNRKLDKKLKSASKSSVPFVLFVGNEELAKDIYRLKDMKSGKETTYTFKRVVQLLNKQ